jgi:hypothetical protein
VGGFFRLRHRAKFTSVRLAEMKKAKRCGAADGFLTILVGYKGILERFLHHCAKTPYTACGNMIYCGRKDSSADSLTLLLDKAILRAFTKNNTAN